MSRIEVLFELWRTARVFPYLRLTQLIVNATGRNDPFYVSDDQLACDLQAYRRLYRPKASR